MIGNIYPQPDLNLNLDLSRGEVIFDRLENLIGQWTNELILVSETDEKVTVICQPKVKRQQNVRGFETYRDPRFTAKLVEVRHRWHDPAYDLETTDLIRLKGNDVYPPTYLYIIPSLYFGYMLAYLKHSADDWDAKIAPRMRDLKLNFNGEGLFKRGKLIECPTEAIFYDTLGLAGLDSPW